jgi:ATPase subunit of ABC transporter with duplicated ATPase domains
MLLAQHYRRSSTAQTWSHSDPVAHLCRADEDSSGLGIPPDIMLAKLGFPHQKQAQYVSSLSGGEMRRLHLASVLARRPNFLILDEPTNDLDLQTIEVRPR